MAEPAKSASVLAQEKKSHRTKAELAARAESEKAALSGIEINEYQDVKKNKTAHEEFERVIKILNAVGKNDAIYEAVINEYCTLKSDIDRYIKLRERIENDEALSPATLYKLMLDCDRQIGRYKDRRFAIEKENGMTIASALRAIPKKAEKTVNPLLEALKDDD